MTDILVDLFVFVCVCALIHDFYQIIFMIIHFFITIFSRETAADTTGHPTAQQWESWSGGY